MAFKSPDFWGAYACSSCHDVVDRRVKHHYTDEFLARQWLRAIHETQSHLFSIGLLKANN
jgi:hypothetical protein